MKTKKLLSLAFLALFAGVIFQGCSKDEDLTTTDNQTQWTVRPILQHWIIDLPR